MNIAEQKKRRKLVNAPLRIPQEIRDKAQELAKEQSTEGVAVKEAEVYRAIIENFFAQSSTKCIR